MQIYAIIFMQIYALMPSQSQLFMHSVSIEYIPNTRVNIKRSE